MQSLQEIEALQTQLYVTKKLMCISKAFTDAETDVGMGVINDASQEVMTTQKLDDIGINAHHWSCLKRAPLRLTIFHTSFVSLDLGSKSSDTILLGATHLFNKIIKMWLILFLPIFTRFSFILSNSHCVGFVMMSRLLFSKKKMNVVNIYIDGLNNVLMKSYILKKSLQI